MRKVIAELVETERTYVRHLQHLMETYLEPLKQEGFLSGAEVTALFGNIQEIYQFQQGFLRALEATVDAERPAFLEYEDSSQFKVGSEIA